MPSPTSTENTVSRYVVDPDVHIGHIHLKVAILDRALKFYSGVLGFEIIQRWVTPRFFYPLVTIIIILP